MTTTTQLVFDYLNIPADTEPFDAKRFIAQNVLKWTNQLVDRLQDSYGRAGGREGEFSIVSGRKYYKIVQRSGGVHAFVDKKTGQVYKPASWKSPAKHVRYDLRIINNREYLLKNADWAGGYLYMR
tara:strand:- start:8 stop:385 length:378 start_codon:yes stop_codon:yes gene_type:complete